MALPPLKPEDIRRIQPKLLQCGVDGRGHFLSGYDGEEGEQGEFYIYRTN